MPTIRFLGRASKPTTIHAELRIPSKRGNFTPDVVLATCTASLASRRPETVGVGHGGAIEGSAAPGDPSADDLREAEAIELKFDAELERDGYAFVCLTDHADVCLRLSDVHVTGVARVRRRATEAGFEAQIGGDEIGAEDFEFWTPERRPHHRNLAIQLDPAPTPFESANLNDGYARPFDTAHAWVAALDDEQPVVELMWRQPQTIARVDLAFDTDFDHPMQSVIVKHPEAVAPMCVRQFRILDGDTGRLLYRFTENHHARYTAVLETAAVLQKLRIELERPAAQSPASLFEVRCYREINPES